jgi:hypothetical protein
MPEDSRKHLGWGKSHRIIAAERLIHTEEAFGFDRLTSPNANEVR